MKKFLATASLLAVIASPALAQSAPTADAHKGHAPAATPTPAPSPTPAPTPAPTPSPEPTAPVPGPTAPVGPSQ